MQVAKKIEIKPAAVQKVSQLALVRMLQLATCCMVVYGVNRAGVDLAQPFHQPCTQTMTLVSSSRPSPLPLMLLPSENLHLHLLTSLPNSLLPSSPCPGHPPFPPPPGGPHPFFPGNPNSTFFLPSSWCDKYCIFYSPTPSQPLPTDKIVRASHCFSSAGPLLLIFKNS